MDRKEELLILRATPLTFGVFGHMEGDDGKRIVEVGGSGILVAPFTALTAGHVSTELLKLDWRGNRSHCGGYLSHPRKEYFKTQYSSTLFQAHDPFGIKPTPAIWQVHWTWNTAITDISLMQVSAENEVAIEMQAQTPRFFEWALLPPPVGSEVLMLGSPKTEITIADGKMNISLQLVSQVGRVSDVREFRRDKGMMNFPCFQIDKPVDHGFSGGPVFWGERLCGIVSGGGFEEDTWAATRWPLCLMEYENPDIGSFGAKMTFGDLFEKGVLHSEDWSELKHRISKRHDDNDAPYAYIENGVT